MIQRILRARVALAGLLLAAVLGGAGMLVFQPQLPVTLSSAQEIPLAPQPTLTTLAAVPVAAGMPAATASATTTPASPPPPPALKVYVTGAVAQPGVYPMDDGARIEDAIRAAGGALADANLDAINLSARVHDEEQIRVPRNGEAPFTPAGSPATPAPATAVPSGAGAKGSTLPSGPVNINSADATTLATLPGIGPVLAGRIVDYRTAHGPFTHIEDIQQVKGIGAAIFAEIQPFISVAR